LYSKSIAHLVDDKLLYGQPKSCIIVVILNPFLVEVSFGNPAIQNIDSDVIFQRIFVLGELLVIVVPSDLADLFHVRFATVLHHIYQHHCHTGEVEDEDEDNSDPTCDVVFVYESAYCLGVVLLNVCY